LAHSKLLIGDPAIDGAHDLGLVLVDHQVARDPLVFGDVAIAIRRFTTEIVAGADFLQAPPAKALLE
jgi:hypothetical protein